MDSNYHVWKELSQNKSKTYALVYFKPNSFQEPQILTNADSIDELAENITKNFLGEVTDNDDNVTLDFANPTKRLFIYIEGVGIKQFKKVNSIKQYKIKKAITNKVNKTLMLNYETSKPDYAYHWKPL